MSSSEGSETTSSSKLSEFGLYRSIDARTEEFLRLSRKRQIRQGCACAAVSTAITVTVVVTVLLVYEYSVNAESSSEQNPRRTSWPGLFNDTSFEAKYNKAKLNIDPATLKLLPIILKALHHNRFLEILIEDSSASPKYDRQDASETPIKRSPFFDRVRTPSKLYAVDNKLSPVVHYKIPTSNLEYYTKIRKIRDYQRILKYFDRMINDKIPNGPIVPIKERSKSELVQRKYKEFEKSTFKQTTIPTKTEAVATILKKVHTKSEPVIYLSTEPKKYVKHVCQCRKKLGVLLGKLVLSIQELLPELFSAGLACKGSEALHLESQAHNIIVTTANTLKVSKSSKITTTNTPKTTQAPTVLTTPTTSTKTTSTTPTTTSTTPITFTKTNIVTEPPFFGTLPKPSKIIVNFPTSTEPLKRLQRNDGIKPVYDEDLNNVNNNIYAMIINSMLRPKYELRNHDFDHVKFKIKDAHSTTTNKNVAEDIKSNSIQANILTTKANNVAADINYDLKNMKEIIPSLKKKTTPYTVLLDSDNSQEGTTEKYNKHKTIARAYDGDYNNIKFELGTLKNYYAFDDFGISSLEVFKKKISSKSSENRISHKMTKEPKKGQSIQDSNLGIIRKISDFIDNTDSIVVPSKILTPTIQPQIDYDYSSYTFKKAEEKQETTTKQNIETTLPQNKSRLHFQVNMLNNEDNRVMNEEDIQEQESMTQMDSTHIKAYSATKPKYDFNQTSTMQTLENPEILRSMIPYSRPLYLEIRRNDWKPEHPDDDANVDYNFFDAI